MRYLVLLLVLSGLAFSVGSACGQERKATTSTAPATTAADVVAKDGDADTPDATTTPSESTAPAKPSKKKDKAERAERDQRGGFDAKSGGLGALFGSIMTLITRSLFGGGKKR